MGGGRKIIGLTMGGGVIKSHDLNRIHYPSDRGVIESYPADDSWEGGHRISTPPIGGSLNSDRYLTTY